MVERWTLPFDFGGSEMTPAPGGEFVSYADYEAAERKVAELEMERDDLAQRAAVIDEALTNAVQLRTAAEADKARLSEALRPFADMADYLDSETEGFSETDEFDLLYEDHLFHHFKVADFRIARAALSGSGSGWPVPDGWKLVPVEPTEAMYRAVYKEQDDSAIHNYGASPTFDDYWAVALEAAPLPAAPTATGGR